MGNRRACDSPDLPQRPEHEICISNGDGSASCYDNRPNPRNYQRKIEAGDFVTNITDYNEQDKWIKFVLDSCKGK